MVIGLCVAAALSDVLPWYLTVNWRYMTLRLRVFDSQNKFFASICTSIRIYRNSCQYPMNLPNQQPTLLESCMRFKILRKITQRMVANIVSLICQWIITEKEKQKLIIILSVASSCTIKLAILSHPDSPYNVLARFQIYNFGLVSGHLN